MLHAGDLVNRGNREAEWAEWCDAGGWVNSSIPTIAVVGNHEYDIDRSGLLPASEGELKKLPRSLSSSWKHRFEFRTTGRKNLQTIAERRHSMSMYRGVRIIGAEFDGGSDAAVEMAGEHVEE
jgi:predicted MPP superfamily phosphohydrolase